jgi:methyl-accepting chemotaxis protein/methyl-accepting chemotaxis protein-1 (serine sensor receptor)
MSLGKKLTLCFVAIAALGLALSYSSLQAIRRLSSILDHATNVAARKMDLVTEIRAGFQELENHAKKTQFAHAILRLEGAATLDGTPCSACHAVSASDEDAREFEAEGVKIEQQIAQAKGLIADSSSRSELDVLDSAVRNWIALYREYLIKIGGKDFTAAHDIMRDKMLPVLEGIDNATGHLVEEQRAFFRNSNAEAHVTADRNRWIALVLVGMGALAIAIILWVVARTTVRLRHVAADLGEKAETLSQAAETVSSSGAALAQGASEQTGAIEEVAASSTDISSTARQNADHARNSAEVSAELSRSLGDASQRLEHLLSAMRGVQESSSKVANIIKVIDGVAFQTNILALNAAVEAARAGEAGLGFAVVAGEVRTLAQRSAEAARETTSLIEDSIAASENGMAKLADVRTAFQALAKGADSMTRLSGDVRAGSLDQAQRVESITVKIGGMRLATQGAADSAEENARTGEELSAQAGGLRDMVCRLLSIIGGRRSQ